MENRKRKQMTIAENTASKMNRTSDAAELEITRGGARRGFQTARHGRRATHAQ